MTLQTTTLSVLAILALSLPACDSSTAPPATTATVSLPAGMVVRGAALGTDVAAAKSSAKQGDEIIIVGRIGGSEEPFVSGRAVFTIVDPALKSCADAGDPDHCSTPWDYCCEDRASLKRSTATIEIIGTDGRPISCSVQGISGLNPLATIAVTGTVTERNDAGLFVVRAKKIEVR